MVDFRHHFQIVHHTADVVDPVGRVIAQAWRTRAGTLVAGVGRDSDIACFGQFLSKETRYLFFIAAVRMCYGNGWIEFRALFIIVGRQIDIGRDRDAIQVIMDRADVYLAFDIFRNRTVIDQAKRIALFFGAGHALCIGTCRGALCSSRRCRCQTGRGNTQGHNH